MTILGYDIRNSILYILLTVVWLKYMMLLWTKRHMIIKSWNYPGPMNLPVIGAAYLLITQPKNLIIKIMEVHSRYSGCFKLWFGPQLIYCIHEPKQIETILGGYKNLEKPHYYDFATKVIGPGLLTAPVSIWKRHRKHIAPTFNQQILNTFVDIFAERSTVLNKIFAQNSNKKFDIFECMSKCMLDITVESTMNQRLNIQEEHSEYALAIDKVMKLTMTRIFHIWNHSDFIWEMLGYEKELRHCSKTVNSLVDTVIRQKQEELESQKINRSSLGPSNEEAPKRMVFLDYLLQTHELSDREIRDEIMIFLFAGTDTSAVTLSFLFAVLGMLPDVQQKVYDEVISVLGNDRTPEYQDLPFLTYTDRVIKETLRLFPAGCFYLRSISEDVEIDGSIIPKDSSVFVCSIYLHRNPKYWPNPLKFDPDRFLPEEVAKRHPCTFIPFSYGPRNCIGLRFAMMAMKTVVATVIRKFTIQSEYKTIDDIKVKANLLLRFQEVPKVTVTPRKA